MKIKFYKAHKILAEMVYLFLIAFFCYTASNKLINLTSFQTNLIKTTMFSKEVANWFSVLVVIFEFVVVLILLFNKKIGLWLFSSTLLIFTLYISFLRSQGLYEVCGCGGVLNGLSYSYHLLINILLIIGSVYCLIIQINSYEK